MHPCNNLSAQKRTRNEKCKSGLTAIIWVTTVGRIVKGNCKILNNEIATKDFSAFKLFPIITYTANVARETCKQIAMGNKLIPETKRNHNREGREG